jgi:putative membrane protein
MKKSFNEDILNAAKGFGMGSGVVPGVSAGTIALMTGILEPMLASIDALLSAKNWKLLFSGDIKSFWKAIDGRFLIGVLTGFAIGFVLLGYLVKFTLAHYPVQTMAFFFALILVSSIYMLAGYKGCKLSDCLLLAAGIAAGALLALMPQAEAASSAPSWYLVLSGALAVCSMILPGISGSFILLIMGIYNYMLDAFLGMEAAPVLWFVLGCAIGMILFSKGLHWLLANHQRPTMMVLLGFVLGFLIKVWPWNDLAAVEAANMTTGTPGDLHVPGAVIWFAAGAILVIVLEFLGAKGKRALR